MSTPPDQLPPVPVTPDFFIPQVPFKQLPFPWDDLTNTPQPDATQYYPDHAPSVVATLAGMHPTNQQGQTLLTDGDHALLVKNVGGGGASGGIPIKPLITSINNAEELGPGGSNNFQLSKRPTLLYQFECHVVLTDPAAADRGYFQVAFIGVDTDIYFTMGVAAIPPANHVPAGFTVSTNINREWAGGLDLSAIYADDSAVRVNAFSINCNFWGYWSCDYEGA